MDVRVGPWKRVNTKALILLNCDVGEDSWESLPWTARRSNQSILKEINPEYSLEGLMLKLKLQHFGHLMGNADSLEKILMLGKMEGDDRGWDGWMASLTQWTWIWANSRNWWWTRKPGVLQSMGSQRVGHDWATELKWLPYYSKDLNKVRMWENNVFQAEGRSVRNIFSVFDITPYK